MSVFAAVATTFVKITAEKLLLSHDHYLRELLDTNVLEALIWIDTRDMIADGMTKGAVDREAIRQCLKGIWQLQHAARVWLANKKAVPRHVLPSGLERNS